MKKKYQEYCKNSFIKWINALVCAVSATIVIFVLIMQFIAFRGGYHGMSYEQMIQTAKEYSLQHLVGELLTDLSFCPTEEYDPETGKGSTRSFGQVREDWKKTAQGFEGSDRMDYAVIVSELPEEGFLEQPIYIYRSPDFATYTGYMQLRAFTKYYSTQSTKYGMVMAAPYKSYSYLEKDDPLGKTYYLTVLYQLKEDAVMLNADQQAFIQTLYEVDHNAALMLGIAGFFFVLSLVHLCVSAGMRKDSDVVRPGRVDRIPLLVLLFFAVMAEMIPCLMMAALTESNRMNRWFSFSEICALFSAALIGMILVALAILATVCVRLKTKTFLKTTFAYYGFRLGRKAVMQIGGWAAKHIPLAGRLFIALPVLGVVSILEAAMIEDCGAEFAALFILARLFSLGLMIYLLWGYGRLRDGAARIAAGDLEQPVKERFLTPDYRLFAKDLNSVGESIQIAVEERMKSERLKTALITNVSHDIKTPLTSIINYVDLLSQDDATEEEKKEYLGILAHQSDRLKKLIQDLIDASKASSGAVEVNLSEVDLSTMIGQVTGEYQDKLDAAGLTIVGRNIGGEIKVSADTNHLWRVLDNLFVNILKYAMPGTRVYLEAGEEGGMVTLGVSNISKAELGISGDELMERFVRGDASRNTEGSGLGLSIAKSLMERMGGDLLIHVDGDMFKAVLKLKKA